MGRFGDSTLSAWVVPCITTAATITILLFGANSDLFGRRPFLLFSNLINAIGYAVLATSTNSTQLIAGLCLNGCGSGTAGIALIACPELLPNKYRHVGVVLADGFVYLMIIIGPVVGRAAISYDDDRWKYLYWAGFIISCTALLGLAFLYCESRSPGRGVRSKRLTVNSPTETSKRRAMERRSEGLRLGWSLPFHPWSDDGSL